MDDRKTESCGRCGLSSVVDATGGGDAYDGDRIEVDEAQLRAASWHVELVGRAKRRVDAFVHRLIYGR